MTSFERDFRMTISGKNASSNMTIDIINPATGDVFASAPDASEEQLDEAVAAARAAFPAWKATPIAERRTALIKMSEVLGANSKAFARLFTLEQGRPVGKAEEEILGAAYWCQAVAQMEIPVTVNEDSAERRSETRHVPIGVVGGIVPWNFPMLLGIWKIAPALLTGNTLVIKPSPFTPLTMLKLAELMQEHLPPGVFNVVSGGDRLGPWLTAHPGIDKVSFTGSTETGRRVMASAAASLKRVTLELGGNDAAIVLPDVDVKKVAEQLFWGAFGNSGQICVATKRMYVHEDIYDALAEELVNCARRMKVGDGLEQGSDLGPIQNKGQYERVKNLIADVHAQGQSFLAGGDVPDGKGYFIPVSIVDNPPEDSRVVVEEAFGPVLPLLKFRDVDDAIRRANASEYGLAGSVWAADLDRAADIAARLETGTVWVNEMHYLTPDTVFGGHKQSGIGAENGLDGLLEYTLPQTISMRRS